MATVQMGKNKSRKAVAIAKMAVAVIALVGGAFLLTGCGGNGEKDVPEVAVEQEIVNPLTGEVRQEALPARPLVVSIDNVGDAVPQSWISKADMVYEFPVEGEQTRLQAIYYGEFPTEFGPIRSTRPYFVDLAREYKAIFLAHGWSPQAKEYLLSDIIPYINAMNSSCDFYRVDDKSAPHNSYIKWDEVKAEIDSRGWWSEKQEITPFVFLDGDKVNEGDAATYISFAAGSSGCEFTYDAETGKYARTVDGAAYVDHETGENITVSNILMQKVQSNSMDEKGRLEIDMCAGGDAILFTNGVAVKGTWSRSDLDSRTVFVDADGNEFKLTPGKTWVHVTDQNCAVTYQ